MSVIEQKKSDTVIANDAYDLLSCFANEFDDILYEVAEQIARQRGNVTHDGLVQIDFADVKQATGIVLQALRKEASMPDAPEYLASIVDDASSCVESKLDQK